MKKIHNDTTESIEIHKCSHLIILLLPLKLKFFNILDALWHCEIDLIACLGGDGTLLHASSLFQVSCTMQNLSCAPLEFLLA